MAHESPPGLETQAPQTVDRIKEATHFLQEMLIHYHEPELFRFSLNAFIQAARNITFVMQAEQNRIPLFANWYSEKQKDMRETRPLRAFVDARNTIVKRQSLEQKSFIRAGLFVGRKYKLGTTGALSPYRPNSFLMKCVKVCFTDLFIDKEHSVIGEQLGFQREWKCPMLGNGEVAALCLEALDYFGLLLAELAHLRGCHFKWVPGGCRAHNQAIAGRLGVQT